MTEREVLDAMADTLRGVLAVVSQPDPYPWDAGGLKAQVREDLTAYDLLALDDFSSEDPHVDPGAAGGPSAG